MGFKDFGSETLLSADVDDLLMKQANIRCVNGAEPPGEEGMETHATDRDRVRIYNGAAWIRTAWWSSAGRTGCLLNRNANQSIASGSDIVMLFDTELQDTDAFYPGSGGTITIPAALGGLYIATFRARFDAGVGATGGYVKIMTGTDHYEKPIPANATTDIIHALIVFAAGDTPTAKVAQTSGGNINATGDLALYRIGA